jgi:MarR-like DNA-binding transcriptional regulator SgrR of sgrS sRNA
MVKLTFKKLFHSFLAIALLTGCKPIVSEYAYRIHLQSLPERISPRNNQINIYHFINLLTYYPLFEKDDKNNLKSHFINLKKSGAENTNFEKYQLCLKENLFFSDSTPIEARHLETSLRAAHNSKLLLPGVISTELKDNCVIVRLKRSDPYYFDNLKGVFSTILSEEQADIPIGLGPYRIEKKTADSIILLASSGQVSGSFRKVEFKKIEDKESMNHTRNQQRLFIDNNHVYNLPIDSTQSEQTSEIIRPILKTYYVLVHVRNRSIRERIQNCFPRESFRKVLNLNLVATPGILPQGITGADISFDALKRRNKTNCNVPGTTREIPFYSYNSAQTEGIKSLLRSSSNSGAIKLNVVEKSLDETIRAASDKSIDMITLVGSDATEPDPSAFFNGFTGKNAFTFAPIKDVEENLKKYAESVDRTSRGTCIESAHLSLLESGYVIPLGQVISKQKYSKRISGIQYFDYVHAFPMVHQMIVDQ